MGGEKRLYKNFLFSLQLICRQGPNELIKTIIQKFTIFVQLICKIFKHK